MSASPQLQAYALWLRDRGLPYASPQSQSNQPPPAPIASQVVPSQTAPLTLEALQTRAEQCQACYLSRQRTSTAYGYGSKSARVVFLGDAMFQGTVGGDKAFVGEERLLLDKMIAAMQLEARDVYLTNTLLCPVSPKQVPDAEAFANCRQHLAELLRLIKPELVVILGVVAMRAVLGAQADFQKVRGQFVKAESLSGLDVLTTYHPRDLLKYPAHKRSAWMDLQAVMQRLEPRT